MRIQKLPLDVANQIAAGEVIERPASIVKELLENSKDASATEILIDIGHGGLTEIQVSDNGVGIVSEDLPLAISAYATSKIRKASDLITVQTMGFRGEALASIASVSRLSIVSKAEQAQTASQIIGSGDTFELMTAPRQQGTTVMVQDLFFNAPVRKKFLKSPRIEFQMIEMVVRSFALSAPDIALTLRQDGREIFVLPNASHAIFQKRRMQKLLGKAFMDHAVPVHFDHAYLSGEGMIGLPTCHRSQNDRIFLSLNGRMVKDRVLLHAIRQAYEGLLYPGRHPMCVLNFTLPYEQYDVNVHPTKYEVRFQDPKTIHDCLVQLVKAALEANIETQPRLKVSPKSEQLLGKKQSLVLQPPISKRGEWFPLNERFALIDWEGEWHLLDRKKLFLSMLRHELEGASFPLAHRFLMVPFYMETPFLCVEAASACIKNANALGVTLQFCDDTKRFRVLSVPLIPSSLNLKSLIDKLLTSPILEREELIACLLATTTVIFHEQGSMCLEFLKSGYIDVSAVLKPFSLTACEAWFLCH